MRRSGIKRSKPMKRSRPKVDPVEQKIRDSARDEDCTLRLDLVCRNDTRTVVYCHSNRLVDGKGMGLKAKRGCYGCFDCHEVLDGRTNRPAHITEEDLEQAFDSACKETEFKLRRKGLSVHEI